MTIYSLDILLFLFGTSLLFHVQFELLLPDLHIGFSRGGSGGLVFPSLSESSTVYCDLHKAKGFGIVSKAEIEVFLELSCFFHDPTEIGNLISGSSAFSKSSLNIWKFTVHVLLKPGLENFEHYFTSVWDECNCVVVWAFFGIAFLWDWNENWPFPVLWPLLRFPNLLAYWVQHFHSIILQDLKQQFILGIIRSFLLKLCFHVISLLKNTPLWPQQFFNKLGGTLIDAVSQEGLGH